jgi:uncharacterized membrane protein
MFPSPLHEGDPLRRAARRVAAKSAEVDHVRELLCGMAEEHAHSPLVTAHIEKRAADVQLRIADAITSFAGSMKFVYIHAVLFAVWMLFIERNPWPKLTLIVSLEAIFLSTFVMIGQNRQASFQQAKADHDFVEQEQELKLNTQLTKQIHELSQQMHDRLFTETKS